MVCISICAYNEVRKSARLPVLSIASPSQIARTRSTEKITALFILVRTSVLKVDELTLMRRISRVERVVLFGERL